MKILIIEDDRQIAKTIRDELKKHYCVDIVFTGEDGECQANTNDYDAILIDLGLPDVSGLSVCKKIRKANIKTPILILTGKTEVESKVIALDAGADDYLTKPFSFLELGARLRALMRRNTDSILPNILTTGDLTLDVSMNTAKYRQEEIYLRRKEFGLLEYLMRNRDRVLTRPMILDHVWDSDTTSTTNTVDVHIYSLREKIDKRFGISLIKTIHGLGYMVEK